MLLACAVTAALLLISGTTSLMVARRSAAGLLRRNRAVGIRIPATLASEEGWGVAHRAAAPRIRRGAVGALIAGATLVPVGLLSGIGVLDLTPALAAYLVLTLGGVAWLIVANLAAATAAQNALAD